MDFQVTPLTKDDNNDDSSKPWHGLFNLDLKLVFLGAFVIIAIGALFFFLGRSSFSENKIELRVEGPSEVRGGDLITYKVVYENNSKVDLDSVELIFNYPSDSVVIKDGDIASIENEIINIERVSSGKSGEVEFQVYIVGDRGNVKQTKASMTFTPVNVGSVIKKDAVLSTTITSLPVNLTLVAPPSATDGQVITYILDYRNQTDKDMEDLRIKIETPDLFIRSRSIPAPSLGGDTWSIDLLRAGEGARITVEGVLNGNERESKTVLAILQRKILTPGGEAYIDFVRADASTSIASSFISATLSLNGSRAYSASPGDTLKYVVDFKNDTEHDLIGLNLSVNLEGSMFNFSSVKSNGFFDSRLNTIFWNSSVVPELGILRPNQSGRAEFELKLFGEFPGGVLSSQNSLIKATAVFEAPTAPSGLGVDSLVAEDELITRISSDISFKSLLFVNDVIFGSSGPFPPKVNQKTSLTVKWEINNPVNLISPARISATLPPGVVWEGRVRSNVGSTQLIFDPITSSVIWDIGSIPGGVGSSFPAYEGYFQISVTPSVNQVGKSIKILHNIKF